MIGYLSISAKYPCGRAYCSNAIQAVQCPPQLCCCGSSHLPLDFINADDPDSILLLKRALLAGHFLHWYSLVHSGRAQKTSMALLPISKDISCMQRLHRYDHRATPVRTTFKVVLRMDISR
jgi:hypothetical protein